MEVMQMNEYTFSDLRIGMEEKFSYTVTQEKQDLFTELSGDINPMHLDADYANKVLARTNGGGTCLWYAHGIPLFDARRSLLAWKTLPFTTCGNNLYQTCCNWGLPDNKRKSC